MTEHLFIAIASILVFGIGAQWAAWRFNLPAILLLLISGILAGPVFGFLNPDTLMGDLLTPFISVSVAIILLRVGLACVSRNLKMPVGLSETWSVSG